MLTDHERSLAVQSLRTAHVTKEPCVQLSNRFPNIEIEDSYAISSAPAQERGSGEALKSSATKSD